MTTEMNLAEAENLVAKLLPEWMDTASNFAGFAEMMKLYAEYGASGIASKSQSIANLSVTQAVALLEIPAEEREKFAEQNNAKDMTIRELKEELAKKKAELAEEQSSTKAALAEAQKRHEQENARYKEQAEKTLADKFRIERELEQQKKRQAELIESKDTEAKAQVEAAIKQSREELARTNEEVDALQEELAKMNSKHKAELEAIREEERKNFQEELNAKDKEIEESAKRFSKAVEEHRKEMASTRKDLLKEQSKNSEVATLGKATYAMEQFRQPGDGFRHRSERPPQEQPDRRMGGLSELHRLHDVRCPCPERFPLPF